MAEIQVSTIPEELATKLVDNIPTELITLVNETGEGSEGSVQENSTATKA